MSSRIRERIMDTVDEIRQNEPPRSGTGARVLGAEEELYVLAVVYFADGVHRLADAIEREQELSRRGRRS